MAIHGDVVIRLANAPGVNRRQFVLAALSQDNQHADMFIQLLLRTGYGRLDLRDMELTDAHVQRLASRLAHSTGVTGVDVRGNGAIGAASILALEGAISSNSELLSVQRGVAHWQMQLQAALLPNLSVFLNTACVYFLGLKARCSGELEPEHVAQIGAMAYSKHFV